MVASLFCFLVLLQIVLLLGNWSNPFNTTTWPDVAWWWYVLVIAWNAAMFVVIAQANKYHQVVFQDSQLRSKKTVADDWGDRNQHAVFIEATRYLMDQAGIDTLDVSISKHVPYEKMPKDRLINHSEMAVVLDKYVKPLAEWSNRNGVDHGPAFDAKAKQLARALAL